MAPPVQWFLENIGMLVFVEGGKPEELEKTLRAWTRTNIKLIPHVTPGSEIEQGATTVGGKYPDHYVIRVYH